MSSENVEIVRAAFDAWNAGDMDALRGLYSSDIEVSAPDGWPEPGPFVGQEAVMRQFEQMRETWDVDAIDLITEVVAAADQTVVRARWRGRGHGPDSNIEGTNVMTLRDGKICAIDFVSDHTEALKSVGLQE